MTVKAVFAALCTEAAGHVPFLLLTGALWVVNQLEGHAEICTKTRLAENIRQHAIDKKLCCDWIPETHVLPAGPSNGEARAVWRPALDTAAAADGQHLDGWHAWPCSPLHKPARAAHGVHHADSTVPPARM